MKQGGFLYQDISDLFWRKRWDELRYEQLRKKEKEIEETIEDLKDNEYVIKDFQGLPLERIRIKGNKFYHVYNESNKDMHLDIDHFSEYEYKVEGDEIYIRELYHNEDLFGTIVDLGGGHTISYRVDGGMEIWESRSAWGRTTEKHRFQEDKTEGGWIKWGIGFSSKVRDIVLNYTKGKADLDHKVERQMLITKEEAEQIAKDYLGNIDDVEIHFSQLYESKSYNEYFYYLFHRKNAFKFDKKYVVIVSTKKKEKYDGDVTQVLKFKSDDLKKLFHKKKKKDGVGESDFIRIRFKLNTALFELGNGDLEDISTNLVKKK